MSLDASVQVLRGAFRLAADLQVGDGEVVALLGPNGAGKSTLLRALAGLLPIQAGRVTLAGRVLEDPGRGIRRPSAERAVGMVFQDHLLFPHLTVRENVAFGLRARRVAPREARARADRVLGRLGMAQLGGRRPAELSGGQAQRVALARALVTDPAMLLLDEPLAALDVETRQQVRRELRRHLARFPGPVLVVTHDPLEAVVLAGRLVVLEGGRVVQDASPDEVVSRPGSPWIAQLVGTNLLQGRSSGTRVELPSGAVLHTATAVDGQVRVVVHPRAVAVYRQAPHGSPRNVLPLQVVAFDVEAGRVRVTLDGAVRLVAEVTSAAAAELDLAAGGEVQAVVKAAELEVFPA